MSRGIATLVGILTVLGALFSQGCAQSQYEKPAKEWCLAMRANQMVPVYPLTQDVRPGDVFLVQRGIGQQVTEYKEKGFLSLDDPRKRLPLTSTAYSGVYFEGYFKDSFAPHDYPVRTPETTAVVTDPQTHVPTALVPTPAPRAAFPTYSFTYKAGEGLSLGVPISGIPVALNFLGAQEASAVVTLADASTYQADHGEIMAKLQEWVAIPSVAVELKAACRYMQSDYVFLRVIKRVYLVGAVDVALESKDKTQAGVQAGLTGQATDPNISLSTFDENLRKQGELIGVLNTLASQAKIGGAVNFNLATTRNVGLRESFDRPLVVGYLGMDVPYFQTGDLGSPIPTFERLEGLAIEQAPQRLELEDLLSLTLTLKNAGDQPAQAPRALLVVKSLLDDVPTEGLQKFKGETLRVIALTDLSAQAKSARTLVNNVIDEINFESTVGPNKAQLRNEITTALRKALRAQGL